MTQASPLLRRSTGRAWRAGARAGLQNKA